MRRSNLLKEEIAQLWDEEKVQTWNQEEMRVQIEVIVHKEVITASREEEIVQWKVLYQTSAFPPTTPCAEHGKSMKTSQSQTTITMKSLNNVVASQLNNTPSPTHLQSQHIFRNKNLDSILLQSEFQSITTAKLAFRKRALCNYQRLQMMRLDGVCKAYHKSIWVSKRWIVAYRPMNTNQIPT